jgi:hypothetical protein
MKKPFTLLCYCYIIFFTFSCSDDEPQQVGKLEIEFDNLVGTDNLILNTTDQPYTNAAGETFNVSTLRYYISNIEAKRNDGTIYKDEVSNDGSKGYYLIDESIASSQRIELENVPVGDYTDITFTIGVDAAKVTDGAQTGALDVAKGMFWDWNSGYIFVMLEGKSASSSDESKAIVYHVGGYESDPDVAYLANNVKVKTVSVGSEPAMVRDDETPEIHMIVDVNKFFASPNKIKFSETPVQHSPVENIVVSENYLNTFVVDHVHN